MSLVSGLLNQTITSISKPTRDLYNDKIFVVVYTDVPCRWQEITEHELLPTGEMLTYTVQVWLCPELVIKRGYKLIKDSREYFVMKIEKRVDLAGQVDHIKVWLQ